MIGLDAPTSAKHLAWTRHGILLAVFALLAVGIAFIHSTTAVDGEGFPSRVARGQAIKACAGLVLLFVVSRTDYRLFDRWSWAFYVFMLLVLVALLVTKDPRAATARWIDLGILSIQPSEVMKVSVILTVAHYLKFRESYRRLGGLVVPYGLIFVPMLLVALQPDLGTSLMLPPILLALLFVAGAKRWPLAVTLVAGVAAVPIIYWLGEWMPLLRGYQMRRLDGFFGQFTGDADAQALRNNAYQLYQSLIALGSGGFAGAGYGLGTQNRLRWLPERETDFIFAVIGEEVGFVGAALVLLVFVALILLCLRVARHTREPFGRLVATGVAVSFGAQTIQNVGMTMGLLPITGLTLPFVSFGGSSLVSSCLAIGVVLSVSRRRVEIVAPADLDPRDRIRVLPLDEDRPAGALVGRWPI